MKIKIWASVLLIVILLAGCAGNVEVRPGVYMSSDSADFPFPTSGYTVYFVGESHGNLETKLVFQAYLNKLYEKAGLRDVILEEDQAYETEANAYVHGLSEALPDGLCLRSDILGQIRDFNSKLSDDEKMTVHLVDVDSPLPIVYKHLTELHSKLGSTGETIPIPDLSDFKTWGPKQLYELIDALKSASANQPDILNGLETIHLSLRWYFLGNRVDTGWPIGSRRTFAPIREDVITKNVEYVLSQLEDRPVLVFFGAAHGMKVNADPNPPVSGFTSWVQRLVDENVAVHSIAIFGTSGSSIWRGEVLADDSEGLKEYKLADGTSVVSLFDSHPDATIIYTDLRTEENAGIKLSSDLMDIPASQFYDGIIIFKKFTPMENACPQ